MHNATFNINQAESLLDDLQKVGEARQKSANNLNNMATIIRPTDGASFEREIQDLELSSKNLREGVFRLLVLGDMNRGKSTFLNALIGENILPSDVNPCTAVLTILRYGKNKQVTVYFNDDKQPEQLDFETFKRKYTIDPAESKKLKEENAQAFPDVEYAVVEYPLAFLEKGVEVIDSPGLNDTEARNALTLGYINNCHAILFVLSTKDSVSLEEERYLKNNILTRGLSVFFLINAWDLIPHYVLDSEDPVAVKSAEEAKRQYFKKELFDYCQVEGNNLYKERVFEISARNALRRKLQNYSDDLEGTGFPEFIAALNTFLTKERAIAELRQAKTLARQTHRRVHEFVENRIPMLAQDVDELRCRISSVQPEFDKLVEIRDRFKDEIRGVRDRQTDAIVDSFRTYITSLEQTFEADFLKYQPDLKFLDFLRKGKREQFKAALEEAFKKYLTDKISQWSLKAEKDMTVAFSQLAVSAAHYGESYSQITDRINKKLTGQSLKVSTRTSTEDNSPGWAKWAAGILALTTGDVAGVAMAGTGIFNWKQILFNLGGVILLSGVVYAFTGFLLGPLSIALASLVIGTGSADKTRKELVKTLKEEMIQQLPKVVQEQSEVIRQAIRGCFDNYEQGVEERINADIQSRKGELEDLIAQKKKGEINREQETQRLRKLNSDVLVQFNQLEDTYDSLLV